MPTAAPPTADAQTTFDTHYITSSEVTRALGISRTTLLRARERGWLPGAIVVNDGQIFIWEREAIRPHLERWAAKLEHQRYGSSEA